MTADETAPTRARGGPRWLLFGSLALNLFFIGVAVALAIRGPAPPHRWNRDVFVRIDRLAATLPKADGDIVRNAMRANHDAVAKAQVAYRGAREDIRETLRQDPFSIDAMRAAMDKAGAARQTYDRILGDVFADAAAKMSPAGRHALANWHRPRARNKRR
jgi:uncharacterized membrane protein